MENEFKWIAPKSFGSFVHGLLDTAANVVEKPAVALLNDIGAEVGVPSMGDDVVRPVMDGIHNAVTGGGGAVGSDSSLFGDSSASLPPGETRTGPTTFAGGAGGEDQLRGITNFGGEAVETVVVANVPQPSISTESIESLRDFFKRPRKVPFVVSDVDRTIDLSPYFSSPPVSSKLKQYAGIRFTLCMRFHSNYSPDESGFTAIGACPGPAEVFSYSQTEFTTPAKIVCSITHMPHVIFNHQETDSVELKLPYCYWTRFFDTQTLIKNSRKYMSVYAYSDTFTRDDKDGVSMFVWLEDMDLFYPTNSDSSKERERIDVPMPFLPTTEGPEHHSHKSESRVVVRADRIDDVAHAPGITKPMSLSSVTRTLPNAHSDDMLPYFSTPTVSHVITVLVGAETTGKFPVNPLGIEPLANTEFSNIPTKLSVASVLFKFWRGTIDYEFRAYCSKFHNGRIQFGFVPHVSPSQMVDFANDEDLWSNIYSEVWNLRDCSTFKFSCPYRLSEYFAHREGVSGTLIYRYLSPINAPDNVAQSFPILVFTSAGSDFQVCRYSPFRTSVSGKAVVYAYHNQSFQKDSSEAIPTSEGPTLASSKPESFPYILNDTELSFSQAAAVPQSPGYVVQGFDVITSDFDISSCEAFQPTYRAYLGKPDHERKHVQFDGLQMNFSAYIASLFYGQLADPYFYLNTLGQIYQPYGTKSRDLCFPYACNLAYLPHHYSSGISLKEGAGINSRPLITIQASSLQNAQFCYPFRTPPCIFLRSL